MFVYCARSWRVSTALTTHCIPLTCPPVTAETLDTARLVDRLIYLRLHGIPGQPYLYGDNWQTAISAEQVRSLRLPGSLVFLEGCYGALFAQAFLDAGALAVAGSNQATYGKRMFMGASSKIGKAWLKEVLNGHSAGDALGKANAGNNWNVVGDKEARLT